MKTLLSEIAYTVRGEVISEENIYYNYFQIEIFYTM